MSVTEIVASKKHLRTTTKAADMRPNNRRPEGVGASRAKDPRHKYLHKEPVLQQGLAPQVNPRPPATDSVATTAAEDRLLGVGGSEEQHHSTADMNLDSFLAQSDSEILEPSIHLDTPSSQQPVFNEPEVEDRSETEPLDTSRPPAPVGTATAVDKLLALRKDFKKTSVALAKASAHQGFVESCQKMPRGLIHCSAFLSDLCDVEQGYVAHLTSHYDGVVKELNQKRALLTKTMANLLNQVTPEEKANHLDLLEKTTTNVEKLAQELDRKKKRKLETIDTPKPKRKKTAQGKRWSEGERRETISSSVSSDPNVPHPDVPHPNVPHPNVPQPNVPHPNVPHPNGPPNNPPFVPPILDQLPQPLFPPPNQPVPLFQVPQQGLLSMTLAELFARLQTEGSLPSPFQPQAIATNCTLGSGRPSQLANPSGKDGPGQPPQLSRTVQHDVHPTRPPPQNQVQPHYAPAGGQPSQLVHPGAMSLEQPPQLLQQDYFLDNHYNYDKHYYY